MLGIDDETTTFEPSPVFSASILGTRNCNDSGKSMFWFFNFSDTPPHVGINELVGTAVPTGRYAAASVAMFSFIKSRSTNLPSTSALMV